MLTLPAELMNLIVAFAPLFSKPVFEHAKLLLVGSTLAIAIRRVDEGNYGVCVECGVEIPFQRLKVQPVALRCIDCQERSERAAEALRG